MSLLNGLTLAYIGDAIYEVKIRERLIEKGFTKVNDLHTRAIKYTSASGQAKILDYLIESILFEDEIRVFKKGRNCDTKRKAKSVDLATYHKSTGFEALIGYLYLEQKKERLDMIIDKAFVVIVE